MFFVFPYWHRPPNGSCCLNRRLLRKRTWVQSQLFKNIFSLLLYKVLRKSLETAILNCSVSVEKIFKLKKHNLGQKGHRYL